MLAGFVSMTPYEVPVGYFDNFVTNMVALVKERQESSILPETKITPYTVPTGYFEQLPGQVLSRISSGDVHDGLVKTTNPYELPVGYFDGFAEKMLHLAKAQESVSPKQELEGLSPLLSKLEKKSPFTLPEGYFENFANNTINNRLADSLNDGGEQLSAMMESLKNTNVYTVPKGYFQDFSATVLSKVRAQQPGKVISMNAGRKFMRIAAAAVFTGILVLAGFLFINRQASSPDSQVVAQADDTIQTETLSGLQALSDDELSNFIENQTTSLPDYLNIQGSAEIDGDDIKLMLADIPESELKQFIDEYSDQSEVITN